MAFPVGALAETVEDGRTGFLVRDRAEMATAIRSAVALDREHCRAVARERFSDRTMIAAYFKVYARLAGRAAGTAP